MINKENIEISCFQSRLKYSELDNLFQSGKVGEVSISDKFIIVYDISYVLSTFKRICSIEDDSSMDEESVVRLTYNILNSIAHYRHYITSKIRRTSIVIVYSSDETIYDDFSRICVLLQKILNLFGKTIFIEKIDNKSKHIYQHLCYFTCMNISSINNSIHKRCRVVYIGNNELSMQMLRIDRDMIHVKHNYVDCGTDIFFKSIITENNNDISYVNTDTIAVLLSLFGFKHGFPRLESLKNKKMSTIYKIIAINCKEFVDKDNPDSIITNIQLNDKDKELFKLRLKLIDVDFQNNVFVLSKSLLKVWSSKINTNSIHSFNDYNKYKDIELQFNWLNGG